MRHHDPHPSDLHLGLYRQARRPSLVVAVTANGRHRSDGAEGGQHLRRPHITRMDDVVHTLEKLDHSGIEVPVGVGEDTDRENGRGSRRIGFMTGHLTKVSLA